MTRAGVKKRLPVFSMVNYTIFTVIGLITLIPFIHLFAKSVSDPNSVIRGEVMLWPINFHLDTYLYVITNSLFLKAFLATVFLAVVGTLMSVFATAVTAYPLSKPYFKGRKLIIFGFIFAWMCGPSIVPIYLLMKNLRLINNLFSLIFVDLIWCFNMLVMKSYFENIPEEICEAAQIDGASNIRTFFSIILPFSKPVIATICVYSAFGYWNMYFYPYLFITNPDIKPLQLFIYDLINSSSYGDNMSRIAGNAVITIVPDVVRSAAVFLSMLPIMAVYPFVQRYFVKGSLVGAIKG